MSTRRTACTQCFLKTPSDALSRKTVASAFEQTCRQAESVQVELQKYEDEGVVSDLDYVRSRSVLFEEIESLDRLIHWLETDLSQARPKMGSSAGPSEGTRSTFSQFEKGV